MKQHMTPSAPPLPPLRSPIFLYTTSFFCAKNGVGRVHCIHLSGHQLANTLLLYYSTVTLHTLGVAAGGPNATDAGNATTTEEHGPRTTEGQFQVEWDWPVCVF